MSRPIILSKEHKDLPDYYGMVITYLNGDKEEIEVTQHILRDKVYETQVLDSGMTLKLVGTLNVPFFEIWTKDNEFLTIPLSSFASLKLDKRWDKIVKIRNKLKGAKNAKS